ncbi:MAG: Dabb family protein [Clostridia bacterium]|nr:Dabb family protein [Clostridia bacterium]MBR5439100.1 Dabb family protein [Clostridia bacterium]
MIKHVVCFKLKDNSVDELEKATNVLMSMVTKVPTIWGIEVGQNEVKSDRNYDLILQVVVESLDKLNEYQNDKYHVEVVKKYMHERIVSSVAVDYEID